MVNGLAGRLRTRLGVERFTMFGADGAGGFEGGWTPAGSLWAEMVGAGDDARVEGDQRVRRARWTVTARDGDIDPTCRLRWGTRAFAVLGVRHDPGTPDRMKLLVEEVAA
jgi:head-tail adaptor